MDVNELRKPRGKQLLKSVVNPVHFPNPKTRGERMCAFIEEYCCVPEGRLVGQRIRLAPFQIRFILDVYDNQHVTSTAILSMARKNAKTATIACLVLGHLCGPEAKLNSQIVSGAMSRDQAALVFALCAKIIRLDERLNAVCKIVPSTKHLYGLAMNVEYRAISAEASTAYGLSPVLAILDEVGQVRGPTSPFVEAITSAQGAHESPLLIAISTSAASDADMLSLWIDDALRSQDPHIVVHEYKADKNCDLLDVEQWKKANPALGLFRSESDLAAQLNKAARLPALESSARNLLLNQRVSQQSLWLAPTPWAECSRPIDISVFQENAVALGLDLSMRLDLTAAVFAVTDDDGDTHLLPLVFTPEHGLRERADRDRVPYELWVQQGKLIAVPGASVDYNWVAEYLKLYVLENGLRLDILCFDRWRISQFKMACETVQFAGDVEWIEIGQGYKDMSPRITAFEHALLSGKIRHGGHPLLNMAAANAIVVKDPAGNQKLDKAKSTQRIDPLVASVMALFEVTEGSDGADYADSPAIFL